MARRLRRRPFTLAIVLAGGEGKRLFPLTRDRAKPAVPFGGQYRLIDFVLSNLINGGFRRVLVLTQYMSHSLNVHLAQAWRLSPLLGNFVAAVPAQMRTGPRWFLGSADALYQNLNLLTDEQPDYVAVFGADHIYRMDPQAMVDAHIASGAGITVAAIPVPIREASQFGVIEADASGRIKGFAEKPKNPKPMPTDPSMAFASMGNYVFSAKLLREIVTEDAKNEKSKHDIGGNIIPLLVERNEAHVYDFALNVVPGQSERERGYWRDVGTLDTYFHSSMDLVAVTPVFDLYNDEWPILTWNDPMPPAKFVHETGNRLGRAFNSLVASGVIVSGGTIRRSILSPNVRVNSYAEVEDSVLFSDVDVGRGAIVKRAIIDKNVRIPPDARIGVDLESDRQRFTVSDEGVVVIGKNDLIV